MNERIKDMLEQPVFDRLRDWKGNEMTNDEILQAAKGEQ